MMDYKTVESLGQLNSLLEDEGINLVYFSHHNCNVCKVLKPRISELITNNFQRISLYYVNTFEQPEIAGQFSVFTVPTILLFVDNKEYIRESRHISLDAFQERIEKLYSVYFD
jgi:thiol-disulfide isomerase/thioredoxin